MLDTFPAPQVLSAVPAVASSEWVERIVPARPHGALELDLEHAAVEVCAQREGALRILTRVRCRPQGGFDLEHTEKGVRLSDRLSWGVLGSLFGRVQVRTWVPADHGVDVRTGCGPVAVRGLRAPVALRSADGALRIDDVWGPIFAVTSSGSIAARGVRGELRAYTSDGTVEVEDSDGSIDACTAAGWIGLTRVAGPVLARSSSGSIYVGFRGRPSGTVATSSGTIEVAVPADAAFELRAQAQGGSIELDPALCREASGGVRSVRALVNGGGDCLWLRSTGGNVYVRAEPPTAADPACAGRR